MVVSSSWVRALVATGALIAFGCSAPVEKDWVVNADITSVGSAEMYVAGYQQRDRGFVKHLTNGRWVSVHEAPGPLTGVWTDGSGFVVAVGPSGSVATRSNDTWTTASLPDHVGPTAVWGSSPTNVLAVGLSGAVVRYDGAGWSTEEVPSAVTFKGIWGSAADDVFVVGEAGTVLHFDGSRWEPMESGTTEDLNAVWGTHAGNVYAVGGSELTHRHVIVRFDGAAWQVERSGSPYALLGVNGTADGRVVSVGAVRVGDSITSAMLTLEGSSWRESKPGVLQFLWDVQPLDDGRSYVVGPDDTLALVR